MHNEEHQSDYQSTLLIIRPHSFLYGPRFVRSVPESPRTIFSQYGPHARLRRSKYTT